MGLKFILSDILASDVLVCRIVEIIFSIGLLYALNIFKTQLQTKQFQCFSCNHFKTSLCLQFYWHHPGCFLFGFFYRLEENTKCIVFVKRIIVARVVAHILKKLKCLDFWKCECLVGCHSGLRNMSRDKMGSIIEKFSSGEV